MVYCCHHQFLLTLTTLHPHHNFHAVFNSSYCKETVITPRHANVDLRHTCMWNDVLLGRVPYKPADQGRTWAASQVVVTLMYDRAQPRTPRVAPCTRPVAKPVAYPAFGPALWTQGTETLWDDSLHGEKQELYFFSCEGGFSRTDF